MVAPVRAFLGLVPSRVSVSALRERLDGGVAVVTGASRGVGRAVALRCGAAGAHVVLVARGADVLSEVATAVEARGGSAQVHAVDLRDTEAATVLGERVAAQHGAPALLVSNAGHSIHRDLADYTGRFHDVTRLAGVNMLGPIALALPLLSAMRAQRRGHLVSVGSVGMVMPGPGWSVYTATKAGFDAWLRSIAPELAAAGVATTSVHLPLVATAMSAPTYARSRVPALTADEAASWVCRAVVTQPRVIAPWWGRIGGVVTSAFPATAERLARLAWARS